MSSEKILKIKSPDDLIVYNIGRLYVLLDHALSCIYAQFGLNPAKFNLLMVIKHAGRGAGIAQNELGANLYVSAANITKLIDGLERRGLAQRVSHQNDRRVKLIRITDSGSKLLDKVWVEHVVLVNKLLNSFSQPEKQVMHGHLEKFIKDLQMMKAQR